MAVFGIIGKDQERVAQSVYYGLFALQHRGQESCGIVVNDDGVFSTHKDSGLVDDVFKGLPTLILLIAIDVKRHPEVVGVGGDVGSALNVEVHVFVIACNLRADDVVSARGLGVDQTTVALRIAVLGVADVGAKVRRNCLPLLLTGAQINGGLCAGSGDGVTALVLTHKVD